jgi:hypothetical protein
MLEHPMKKLSLVLLALWSAGSWAAAEIRVSNIRFDLVNDPADDGPVSAPLLRGWPLYARMGDFLDFAPYLGDWGSNSWLPFYRRGWEPDPADPPGQAATDAVAFAVPATLLSLRGSGLFSAYLGARGDGDNPAQFNLPPHSTLTWSGDIWMSTDCGPCEASVRAWTESDDPFSVTAREGSVVFTRFSLSVANPDDRWQPAMASIELWVHGVSPIPEPSTGWLMAGGLLALGGVRRLRR